MATAVSIPSQPRRPWVRFTLSGMFVFMLGVGVGLAYWRLPGANVAEGILTSFATWFVIGKLQAALAALTRRSAIHDRSTRARAVDLHFTGSLALAGLIALALAAKAAAKLKWLP